MSQSAHDDEPLLLHHFFERAAEKWPDRIALDIPPGRDRHERRLIQYSELGRLSDRVAAFLSRFVIEECVVAIMLPRTSEHLYLSQLGVLKAGAAYTSIDPSFPDDQVKGIIEDSQPVAIITDRAGSLRAAQCWVDDHRVIDIEQLFETEIEHASERLAPKWLTPGHLAYLIYTSGTTGRPKGVMIEHRSIVNLVGSDVEEFGLGPSDRIAQGSSPAYDSSVEEIWMALAVGATVVVMDDDAVRLGPDLVRWLRDERITVLTPPPTLLRTTGCSDPEKELPDLALIYVGGEALPRDIADRWSRGTRLENGYGPTECAVTALRGTIKAGEPITIGRPLRGLTACILDESLEEVPIGEMGELCLGGIGLARGYRNSPELTAQKFPDHPKFGRIYRTGDLVNRDLQGNYFYHGRIDSQVKLRGYRIELEAIESTLAECRGVREAACRVQQEGAQQLLAAYIVAEAGHTPSFDDLKNALRRALPSYMVPGRFALIGELPKTVGGKLNRRELPTIEAPGQDEDKMIVPPRNGVEEKLAATIRQVLNLQNDISIEDDFFNDLGGDSLHSAILVSLLRDDAATQSVTVRDIYETRTVAALAERLQSGSETGAADFIEEAPARAAVSPVAATLMQIVWLAAGLIGGSVITYIAAFELLPLLIDAIGFISFILLSPILIFAGLVIYTPLSVIFAVSIKKLLIGRYRPLRAPVWGSFYVRNWMVQKTVRIIPWTLLEGTVFQQMALRALGARIGRRVHIHRGVNLLHGGWDLLEIGDDVTISQEAALRLIDLEGGQIVAGSISIGDGATLDIRAGLGGNTVMEPESYLTALSSLSEGGRIPRGEKWDGIPAKKAGLAPQKPDLDPAERSYSQLQHGVMLVAARFLLGLVLLLPLELPTAVLAILYGLDSQSALNWINSPNLSGSFLLASALLVTLPLPLALAIEAFAVRAMGSVRPGVINRWGISYIRVWLKTWMVQSAGEALSGTLFWPIWLRMAGMKVGRDCEISTIIDVVPELIEIGPETFFADGIYLGGPRVHRGTVQLELTRLGSNTFLGNHAVIPLGQKLPDDVLIGVSTVADETIIRPGTSWFGQPPFELPRREVIEVDRNLTHNPSTIRYLNRVFWELLRFTLTVIPVLVFSAWFKLLSMAERDYSFPVFLLVDVPLMNLGVTVFFCLLLVAFKWMLLGRVRPGIHPLWSCWCSRWDFLYVAWGIYARPALTLLEGTLLLNWYLRAMGSRIGRNVVLGGGFAQVVDPDMLNFEEGSTVTCHFQAHTFEDRVLKIDHVWIRQGATVAGNAVMLYGGDVGANTYVAPHSVIMKREVLLPGRSYAGCPVTIQHNQESITLQSQSI